MPRPITRRALFTRTIQLATGAALLPLFQATDATTVHAQASVTSEDVVDAGEGFGRGSHQSTALLGGPGGPVVRPTVDGGVFTSAPLLSPIPFTHLGLHWAATVPRGAGLSFEVRTSLDGAAWSAWETIQIEREPAETPVGDAFGSLLFVGEARYLQYRASFRTARGGPATLRRVTASVIQSRPVGGAGTTLATTTVNDGDSGRSLVVGRREAWGADEGLRFKNGQEVWPEMFVPAKKLVVHHTATRNSYKTAADAAADVRSIYQYHAVTQQWGDIGYTALIDKFGNVYEGRHGRGGDPGDTISPREVLSADVVAGHDYHHNYGSVGVALLGDATRRDWPMPSASGPMWDALVRHCVFEAGRHFLRPSMASDFLRSDGVWTTSMPNVSGHKETDATACPGTPVMNLLPALKNAIQAGLVDAGHPGVTLTMTSDPGVTAIRSGTQLTYTWQAEATDWSVDGYEYCWERWSKPTNSDDIQYLEGYTSGPQPRAAWTAKTGTTLSVTPPPGQVGHATLHVRVLLSKASGTAQRSAYEANHTVLVT